MAHQEASDILLKVRFSSHHWCVDPPLTEAMSLPPGVSCSSGSVKGQENDSGLPCSLQGWQRWTRQIHHIGTPEKSQWLWSWETRGYLENKWWDTVRCHLRQSTWVGHIPAHNCISRGTQYTPPKPVQWAPMASVEEHPDFSFKWHYLSTAITEEFLAQKVSESEEYVHPLYSFDSPWVGSCCRRHPVAAAGKA